MAGAPSSRFRLNRRDSPGSYLPDRTIYQRWFRDWWTLELLAVLASCSLTLILCIILNSSDHELVRSFGLDAYINGGITISAVVALLSNLIVAFALFAISECLGQLKWLWYWDQGRPLRDIGTFDQASRGALGSAQLLWKLRIFRNPIASLGAFLIIAQVVIAPLAQQAVVLGEESLPDPDGASFLPQTRSFKEPDSARTANMPTGYNRLGHGLKSQFLSALYDNLDDRWSVSNPFCSTGNCTVPKYTSMETCNDMTNVTSKLEARTVGSGQVWCMPNTAYCVSANRTEDAPVLIIGSSAGAPALTYNRTGERNQDKNFQSEPLKFNPTTYANHSNPIANFYMIYQTRNSSTGVAAMEFIFDWCVLTMEMGTENQVRNDANETGNTLIMDWHNEGEGLDTNMTSNVNGTTYRVDAHSHNTLQRYLQLIFNGSMYYDPASGFAAENDVVQMFGEVLTLESKDPKGEVLTDNAPLAPPDPSADNPNLKNDTEAPPIGIPVDNSDGPYPSDFAPDDTDQGAIGAHMYNVAVAMSDYTRISNAESELATGTAFKSKQVLMVSWAFISAPIFFAVASLNFFIVVAAHGRGQRHSGSRHRPLVWKTSGIATLRGLDAHLHRSVGGMQGVSGMDGDANGMNVRLMRDKSGWRLVVDDRHEAPRVPAKDAPRSNTSMSNSSSGSITRTDSSYVFSPVSETSTGSTLSSVSRTESMATSPLPSSALLRTSSGLPRIDANVSHHGRLDVHHMV